MDNGTHNHGPLCKLQYYDMAEPDILWLISALFSGSTVAEQPPC